MLESPEFLPASRGQEKVCELRSGSFGAERRISCNLLMEQFILTPIHRYFELELPRRHGTKARWPLLIALHGYQGNKDSMMRVAHRIADGKMIVVSLQAANQFIINYTDEPKNYRVGFGWGTAYKMEDCVDLHHRDLRALIRLATRRFKTDPARVFLLGFSQACAYNYRFVFTFPRLIRGCIAVCGGVPGDWHENPRYHRARTHVLHIAATRDQWYSQEKNLQFRRELAERAASLDFRFYNSPHRFPRTSVPHIRKWIEKHL